MILYPKDFQGAWKCGSLPQLKSPGVDPPPQKKTNRHCPNTSDASKLTWCQLREELWIFFTEPGARWLISLKGTRILTFQTHKHHCWASGGGGAFFQAKWQPRQWRRRKRLQSEPFSSEMNQNGSTVKQWLISVAPSAAAVLTRREQLHSSSLSGSRRLWGDQWCPGSTASAPLLSEGHTSARSGWAERSKITCYKRGGGIVCMHSFWSPFKTI